MVATISIYGFFQEKSERTEPHAKVAEFAKESGKLDLCERCDLCVRNVLHGPLVAASGRGAIYTGQAKAPGPIFFLNSFPAACVLALVVA